MVDALGDQSMHLPEVLDLRVVFNIQGAEAKSLSLAPRSSILHRVSAISLVSLLRNTSMFIESENLLELNSRVVIRDIAAHYVCRRRNVQRYTWPRSGTGTSTGFREREQPLKHPSPEIRIPAELYHAE